MIAGSGVGGSYCGPVFPRACGEFGTWVWGKPLLSVGGPVLPCQWESGPGDTGRKFGSPSTLSTCFLAVGEASALGRLLRGRKGWVQGFPSFSLQCQPSSRCRPLSGLPCFPTWCVPFVCLTMACSGLGFSLLPQVFFSFLTDLG